MDISAIVTAADQKVEGFTINVSVEEFQEIDRALSYVDTTKVAPEGPAYTLYCMMDKALADLGIENVGIRQHISEPCICGEIHNSEEDYQDRVNAVREMGDAEFAREAYSLDEDRNVIANVTEEIFGEGQPNLSDVLPGATVSDIPGYDSEKFSDVLDKLFGTLGLEKDQYGATKGCDCPPCNRQREMVKGGYKN